MDTLWSRTLIVMCVAACGCGPSAVQYPPGTYPYPPNAPAQSTVNTPVAGTTVYPTHAQKTSTQAQIDNQRRWAYAMETASKGAFVGGIFGAYPSMGMGFLGFLYGMAFADAKIAEENAAAQAQYQKESSKDQQLEAAIEQELERQRTLENQIAGTAGPSSATAASTAPARQSTPPQQAAPRNNPQVTKQQPQNNQVASLGKPNVPNQAATPFKNVEVRDTNGDGIPDLWIYYNPQNPGEIVRQEEATKSNGNVDTWSYFKSGKLVRRELDTKGQGRPDTFYYYDNDRITREERDEGGEGRVTYRAFYQNGQIARLEKDTTNHGRPDLWVYYDTTKNGEVVVKEERDLNGDGTVDLWTYFENGRMVRRDVNAVGLDLLTQQDKLPAPAADIKPIAAAGS